MNVGRPSDYKPEYCELILSPGFNGKHIYQIAARLSVAVSTLYYWADHFPPFSEALTQARINRLSMLMDESDSYRVTDRNTSFADKANLEQLKLSGLGRRLPRLKGVEDEHKALQIVQEALADEEILPEYADSMSKLIMTKLEARKVCQMAEDMKLIKEKLGLE